MNKNFFICVNTFRLKAQKEREVTNFGQLSQKTNILKNRKGDGATKMKKKKKLRLRFFLLLEIKKEVYFTFLINNLQKNKVKLLF